MYSVEKRMKCHYRNSKRYDYKFYRALRKYKESDFIWEIIDTSSNYEDLKEMETAWIYHYDSFKNGYNSTLGGEGLIWEDYSEAKEKMSKKKTGKNNPMFGRLHSKKTKKELSERKMGSKNPNLKITEEIAICIKKDILENKRNCDIVKKYGVGRGVVDGIKYNRTWKWLNK